MRVRGTVTFKPDLTDVESLSDGGYLAIRTWSLFIPRTVEIRSEGGRLTHRYYVGGLSRPYDDDARRWLASELSSTLVRKLGLGAESRTRQILAADGVPAFWTRSAGWKATMSAAATSVSCSEPGRSTRPV